MLGLSPGKYVYDVVSPLGSAVVVGVVVDKVITRSATGRSGHRGLSGAVLVVVTVGGDLAPGVGGGEHVACRV